MIKLIERLKRLIVLSAVLLAASSVGAEEVFDHGKTGFELSGGHKFAACESCHMNGQFKGTPTNCVSCHSLNGRFNATPKPINHINTSNLCESCHNVAVWNAVARVDHAEVFGACATCHNPNIAPGKPANHIPTSNQCSDCHSDVSWSPANFRHDLVSGQPCASCHDNTGPGRIGKPANHPVTSNNCDACHRTFTSFKGARFDHDETPIRDNCAACHQKERDAAITHPSSSSVCVSCHRDPMIPFKSIPAAWVDHDELKNVTNNCVSCHEMIRPKPMQCNPEHIQAGECDICHDPGTWTPVIGMGTCKL